MGCCIEIDVISGKVVVVVCEVGVVVLYVEMLFVFVWLIDVWMN